MNNTTIYILVIVIAIIILISTIIMIKNIFIKKTKKPAKSVKKRFEELRKIAALNPKDLDSLYQLAMLEEEYGELQYALVKYKILLKARYFKNNNINETDIYKKLEDGYHKLEDRENSLKYALRISKSEPNNVYYAIKLGNILGREGKYKLACEYFNKIQLSKKEVEIDDLKVAALSFFMNKDYKKATLFIEELYKRILNKAKNEKDADMSEVYKLETLLISIYIYADELNIATAFLEQILSNNTLSEEHKLYINKMYMYVLYKLSDNQRFNNLYIRLKDLYKLDTANSQYASLIFDFGFYAYFLKDIETSIKYFSKVKSFNIKTFDVYKIDDILSYLNEVNKAYIQLTKLRNAMKLNDEKYKNERFDKYVESDLITIWEEILGLWESTFFNFDYINSLVESEVGNTMDIDKVLAEFNAEQNSNNESTKSNITEIDKIYSLSLNNFKKLCQNIIQTKLSYSILQEYSDNIIKYEFGDEVNYLAYHTSKSRKDITLISFKRWKNTEVGELILRDFMLMIQESGAKNGILILPVKLTNSAKSYAKHNDRITVYTKHQFEIFLKSNFI